MFSDPEHNIAQFVLSEGDHVADLGSGSGFYSMAASKAVGGSGQVFAVEIQKDMLDHLKLKSESADINNIEIIWGDVEQVNGTRLRDKSVDAVLITNILFQTKDKKGLAEEAKRILKPGGKGLVVDWSESFNSMGPRPSQIVTEEVAKSIFSEVGFVVHSNITAGDHHYGFIVTL